MTTNFKQFCTVQQQLDSVPSCHPFGCFHCHCHSATFTAPQSSQYLAGPYWVHSCPRYCPISHFHYYILMSLSHSGSDLLQLTSSHFCSHQSHTTAVVPPNSFPPSLQSPLIGAPNIEGCQIWQASHKCLEWYMAHSRCSKIFLKLVDFFSCKTVLLPMYYM